MGNICHRRPQEENHLLSDLKSDSLRDGARSPPFFSAIGYSALCALCDQPIASLYETRKDARGQPYHAQCCRCGRCGRALSGEAVCIREGRAYCRLHAVTERTADVKGTEPGTSMVESAKVETIHVDVSELCDAMIDRIVMMPPTCAACGGIFAAKDEVRCIGAMKLHSDCVIGRPGPGRSAAVAKRTPLQLAKNALDFLAVRVTITPDVVGALPSTAPAAVYTFFLARNETLFSEICRMKVSTQGTAPVTVTYDSVANAHLTTTKRNVPTGILAVVDVAGNFTASADGVRSSGDMITAVLTRVDGGVCADLRISLVWQRLAGVLTMRGGGVYFAKQPEC